MALQKDQEFEVDVHLPQSEKIQKLRISHKDETFEFEWDGDKVSILNNGDNTWETVEGNAPDQELVTAIGEAIERHYEKHLF